MRLSVSKIKTFKSCRRKYQLHYIEGLTPIQKSEALETGSSYHKLLEELNTNGHHWDYVDYSKERAMAEAYYKYIFPNFKVVEAEKWLEYDLGNDDKLVGIADGIADDGHIVEHKSTGMEITEQYEYNLLWDEQILAYMLMTGHRKVWYTVCRKPTIRQKQNETDEEFFNRMVEWYDTDTDSKIRLLEIERTDEEVEEFRKNLLSIALEMNIAQSQHEHNSVVSNPYYKNTCHCNMWGRRCEYSSVCLNYNPDEQYIDFVKGDVEYEQQPSNDF